MTTNLLVDAGAVVRSHGRVTASEGTTTADAVADAKSLAETVQKCARSRVEMMRGYAEADRCRRRYILEYFGESYEGACGDCDVCSEHPEVEDASDDRFALNDRVNHPQWGRGTVSAVESDRITVLFDEQGYKTLSLDIIGDDLDATG